MCGDKDSASIFEKEGRTYFKCFRPQCPSGTSEEKGAWDEVGYLMFKLGLSRTEAFKAYLKETGLWKERRRSVPRVPQTTSENAKPLDPALRECVEALRVAGKVTNRVIKNLGYGFERANQILGQLERMGIIGPAKDRNEGNHYLFRLPLADGRLANPVCSSPSSALRRF
jgi:hypothetical protein